MTATLVVLAAGRGSRLGRIGDDLPKCLLPLDGRAILSHQFDLAPAGTKLVVVTGYRADQVREYVTLAHPDLDVTFVHDERWGTGPGVSLLAAREHVEGDLVLVACDTLWDDDPRLWDDGYSWAAVAPIPPGTPAARWCRVVPDLDTEFVAAFHDKTPDVAPGSLCWTALARVHADDLHHFWPALDGADQIAGEVQLSSGLQAIVDAGEGMEIRHINWLDVGDEAAYRATLAARTGYDPLKPDQVTYVLSDTGRVVKWHVDPQKVAWRLERAKLLGDAVARPVDAVGQTMSGFDYVEGVPLYDLGVPYLKTMLAWWGRDFWDRRASSRPLGWRGLTTKFYRDKTFSRVMALEPTLRSIALDAVTRVDWDELVDGCVPGPFHGDLTFANVIVTRTVDVGHNFTGIDWREDFAGEVAWGDLRYDLAKLLCGTVFHWQRAAYGDLRPWDEGDAYRRVVENYAAGLHVDVDAVRRIAALCLLNSAPLHAAPMDEVLVARGCRLLEEVQ